MQDEETKDISHDVFISYATDKGDSNKSKDSEVAEKVCTALESQDIRCANRRCSAPSIRCSYLGFRLCQVNFSIKRWK